LFVDLFEGLEVILDPPVVRGEMGPSRPVARVSFRHGIVQKKSEEDQVRTGDREADKKRAWERCKG